VTVDNEDGEEEGDDDGFTEVSDEEQDIIDFMKFEPLPASHARILSSFSQNPLA
jgi:hypothetical protein